MRKIIIFLILTSLITMLTVGCKEKPQVNLTDTSPNTETSVEKRSEPTPTVSENSTVNKETPQPSRNAEPVIDIKPENSTNEKDVSGSKNTDNDAVSKTDTLKPIPTTTKSDNTSKLTDKPIETPTPNDNDKPPVLLPPAEKPKESGIDWDTTSKFRHYIDRRNMYTGIKKNEFDQYLLDIVNKKMTPDEVINKVQPMSWKETWIRAKEGEVTYVVNYCKPTTYETELKDIELILSKANNAGKIWASEYKQVLAYYNADSQSYTLYFLNIKFSYMKPK